MFALIGNYFWYCCSGQLYYHPREQVSHADLGSTAPNERFLTWGLQQMIPFETPHIVHKIFAIDNSVIILDHQRQLSKISHRQPLRLEYVSGDVVDCAARPNYSLGRRTTLHYITSNGDLWRYTSNGTGHLAPNIHRVIKFIDVLDGIYGINLNQEIIDLDQDSVVEEVVKHHYRPQFFYSTLTRYGSLKFESVRSVILADTDIKINNGKFIMEDVRSIISSEWVHQRNARETAWVLMNDGTLYELWVDFAVEEYIENQPHFDLKFVPILRLDGISQHLVGKGLRLREIIKIYNSDEFNLAIDHNGVIYNLTSYDPTEGPAILPTPQSRFLTTKRAS